MFGKKEAPVGENKRKMKKKKKLLIGGILVLVCAAGAIGGGLYLKRVKAQNETTTMTVQSASAESGNISSTVTGTGSLASKTASEISVPIGLEIDEILVEEGDTVKKGQKLATVTKASVAEQLLTVNENIDAVEDEIDDLDDDADTEGTDSYLEKLVLEGELEDLEDAQEKLEELLDTLTIYADAAGTIDSISVSEGEEITSSSSGSTNSSSSSSASVINTSVSTTSTKKTSSTAAMTSSSASVAKLVTTSTKAGSATAKTVSYAAGETVEEETVLLTDSESDSEETTSTQTEISSVNLTLTAPVTGASPNTSVSTSDAGYTVSSVSWNCSTNTYQSSTAYTATIVLTANDGYAFAANPAVQVASADVTYTVYNNWNSSSSMVIQATYAQTAAASKSSSSDKTSGNTDNDEQNVTVSEENDSSFAGSSSESSDQNTVNNNGSTSSNQTAAAGGATTGSNSGGSGAVSTEASSTDSSSEEDSASTASEYNAYEAVAFTIASTTEGVVSINVDELDIASVQEGQTVSLTFDALEDQTFEGEITSVSTTASSDSSSAKYPVEISLDIADGMMIGMSASATIQISEATDAVLIPVSALQERGNSTFVYTEQDEDGNLTGEVEVETGLSNDSQVEIVSGLSEGDTVYYLKAEGDSSEDSMQGGMGGMQGDMPSGGGDMPSGGGDMPSGGGPGGGGSGGGPGQ